MWAIGHKASNPLTISPSTQENLRFALQFPSAAPITPSQAFGFPRFENELERKTFRQDGRRHKLWHD
jgi:hypothetical protein